MFKNKLGSALWLLWFVKPYVAAVIRKTDNQRKIHLQKNVAVFFKTQ